MLLQQQIQDNMLEGEVVSFGQRAQQQQDQQQLQLRQHNIPHNPVYLKQMDSNQVGSIPMSSNSIGLDQVSFQSRWIQSRII